jgi:hypothetical protein
MIAVHHVEGPEAAEDETLGVERNFARDLETLVLVHPGFRALERRLVGPDLPGEDDLLALLCSDRAAEIRVFPARDIVLPGFDDLDAAIFPEDRRPVLGPLR